MKAYVKKTVIIDVDILEMIVEIMHGDEDMSYDFPFREGDIFHVKVDINKGQIIDWPKGEKGRAYICAKDMGDYYLYDRDGHKVAEKVGHYVPNNLIPGEFGDVIDMDIDENGFITNWPTEPDLSDFDDYFDV